MPPSGLPTTSADVATILVGRRGQGVTDVEALAGGAWSSAFSFEEARHQLVVRFSVHEEDFRKDEVAARYASPALPVPPILEIGRVDEAGFYAVSERRHGSPLELASEAETVKLLPAVLRMLEALREVDLGAGARWGPWDPDAPGRFGSWREALLSIAIDQPGMRTAGWRTLLAASAAGDRAFELGYAALEEAIDDRVVVPHLVHSDLMNRNVLVDGDRVTAVLDWGSSIYGDFLLDLGWLTFWAPWYPAWRDLDVVAAARDHCPAIGLAVPGFDGRLRACELWIGLDGMAYQAWAGHGADLERTAARTLEIVQSPA